MISEFFRFVIDSITLGNQKFAYQLNIKYLL